MINNGNPAQGRIRKGAIALILITGLLGGCEWKQTQANAAYVVPASCNSAEAMPTTETNEIEQVVDNGDRLMGQWIIIQGEVEKSYSSNLYRVQEQGKLFGDSILVVTLPAESIIKRTLTPSDNVQVAGEVQKLVMADFEKTYNLNLTASVKQKLQAEYECKPMIIAEAVQVYE